MEIKKFNELTEKQLDTIINKHFNHWSKYSPIMTIEDTENKIKKIYTSNQLPYGIALCEGADIIGFCMLKKYDLNDYKEITPNICNIMIFDQYRGKGYGKMLVECAKEELKSLGYQKAYLWTDKVPSFYEKMGFTYVKDVLKNDKTGYGRLYVIDL